MSASAAAVSTPTHVSGWRQEDYEHYRREGFPVYSLKRDEKRQELLDLLVADHATIIDASGRITGLALPSLCLGCALREQNDPR
jgi:hypothetical protein